MKKATFALLMLLFIAALPALEASDSSPPVGIELIITFDQEFDAVIVEQPITIILYSGDVITYWNIQYLCKTETDLIQRASHNRQSTLDSFLGPGDIIGLRTLKFSFT